VAGVGCMRLLLLPPSAASLVVPDRLPFLAAARGRQGAQAARQAAGRGNDTRNRRGSASANNGPCRMAATIAAIRELSLGRCCHYRRPSLPSAARLRCLLSLSVPLSPAVRPLIVAAAGGIV
jgi:hypothetical protein